MFCWGHTSPSDYMGYAATCKEVTVGQGSLPQIKSDRNVQFYSCKEVNPSRRDLNTISTMWIIITTFKIWINKQIKT